MLTQSRAIRRHESDESYKEIESCFTSQPLATLREMERVLQQMTQHTHLTADKMLELVQQVIEDKQCNAEHKEEEPSPFTSKQELAGYSTQVAATQIFEEDDDTQSVKSADSEDELLSMTELKDMAQINAQNAGTTTNGLQELMKTVSSPPSPPSPPCNLNKNAAEWFPGSTNSKKSPLCPVAEDAEIPKEEEVAPLTPPTSSMPSVPVSFPALTSSPVSSPAATIVSSSKTEMPLNAMLTQTSQTIAHHTSDFATLPPPPTLFASVPAASAPAQLVAYMCIPGIGAPYLLPVVNGTLSSPPSQQSPIVAYMCIPGIGAPYILPVVNGTLSSPPSQQTAASVPNQFDYTPFHSNTNMTSPDTQPVSVANTVTSNDEYKVNEYYDNNHGVADDEATITTATVNVLHTNNTEQLNESAYKPAPATPPASRAKEVAPAHNNPAKGNFYISKEKIEEMTQEAEEEFHTDERDDEKLAFGYYKESVGMQINDRQIREHATKFGPVVIINIDLHFKSSGKDMYLVATENHEDFKQRVRWQIHSFMTAEDILSTYGIAERELPRSSRYNEAFDKALLYEAPTNLVAHRVHIPDLTKIPKKHSKRDVNASNMPSRRKPQISQWALKKAIKDSFRYNKTPTVPVVVIKGKSQWIEWKKFAQIRLENGKREWIGISLRYHESNDQWRVECIDLDAGRIYYQHRLVGLRETERHCYSYQTIMQYVTIPSLNIHN
eukprot:CAMPEP_0197072144 /NCGR_PEP_ID=MMETSP1384-20130603/209945_1 /TAXON_ID=29189 /ORGANISM="Ammonia sp." /LENGTH=722 /DNA_ID=CAMNT_0042510959 /DNA_START=81 /DNA_END=2250 /DNA_ORIENTATION=-